MPEARRPRPSQARREDKIEERERARLAAFMTGEPIENRAPLALSSLRVTWANLLLGKIVSSVLAPVLFANEPYSVCAAAI